MEFERSYKLKIEEIAQKHEFSTGTPGGLGYTVIHNSKHFNTHYMFGDWEDERIIIIYFEGSQDDPKVDIQQIRLYREGIEAEIRPFVEEVISELHSGDEEPQRQLVATGIGKDTRCFGLSRRKIKSTIKSK